MPRNNKCWQFKIHKMKKSLFLFLIIGLKLVSQQNLQKNYYPLKSEGVLPEVFTQDIRKIIKTEITELYKGKENDKALKTIYLTESNYEIEKIVKSGNTLINDEITKYLNKLADLVLKNNPTLRSQLHIFTLKSAVVNAYSYDKGYLFFDIGLIAQAETEAQMAYIMSHEIAHYVKKHNINGYVKNKKIENDYYSGKTNADKLIEKCQYSKEYESEADIEGFRLFEQTNFNFAQAEKAFDVLQYAHLPFELVEFNKSFLETEYFKIPNGYFLKEVSSIRNNANEDDSKSTHPNTTKRKAAIGELIKARTSSGRVDNLLGEEQFNYIRDLSRFELCRLYLKNRDYANTFYAAYILSKKYSNNVYLTETISKCLYAISLYNIRLLKYNNDSYLSDGIKAYGEVESFPQQIYYLISKMPPNEWTIMSLNYVYRAHKKFPEDEVLGSLTDSLFKMLSKTSWGIVDFVRTNKKPEQVTPIKKDSSTAKSKTDLIANIQKENNFKNYDTAYYKEAFVDLFMEDKEFVGKFPASGSANQTVDFTEYSMGNKNDVYRSKKHKKGNGIHDQEKIEKVLILEPFFIQINYTGKNSEITELESDLSQEELIKTVNLCAEKQNFKLVTLDPGLITSADVDKMNDYSVINDWIYEKVDGSDNTHAPIFNTNDINKIISKYGTQYILKTGIVSVKGTKTAAACYGALYDLKKNKVVYMKQEIIRGKATKDFVNAKIYQMFYELKTGK